MTRLELRILQSASDYPELSVRGLATAATSPVPLDRGEAESGVSVSAVVRQQVRDAEGVVRKLMERGFLEMSDDGVVLTPKGVAVVDPASRRNRGLRALRWFLVCLVLPVVAVVVGNFIWSLVEP